MIFFSFQSQTVGFNQNNATACNLEGKRSRGRPRQDNITRKEATTWNRKAIDRGQWKTLVEGYILQWMDKAEVKGER